MATNGMTINGLNPLSELTADDKIPVWDTGESGEPTKEITAQNMANSVKSLASLLNTTEMNTAIAQSTAPHEIKTGINDLSAIQSGKVVELVYKSTSGITVPAGGFTYVGYLPSNLRPYANLSVCGAAADDSGKTGVVSIQSVDGRIFIRSAVQATFLYFSLTYII